MRQKYVHGDLVEISKSLPASMSHFEGGVKALVVGSYDDQYGEEDAGSEPVYTLMLIPDLRSFSWYPESTLTLIEHKGAHFLRQAKEHKQDADFESDKKEKYETGFEPVGTHRRTWKRIGDS